MTIFKKASVNEDELMDVMEKELNKLAEEPIYLSDVPKGWTHKYYYDTHWVFEYESPPAPKKYWLKPFKGDSFWSDVPTLPKQPIVSEAKKKKNKKDKKKDKAGKTPKNPGKTKEERKVWKNYGYWDGKSDPDKNDVNNAFDEGWEDE